MDEPAAGKIRLLLMDALGLFRASLGRYLSSESGFEVAGECASPAEALEILNGAVGHAVDVVLLDFDLGTEHADDFIPAARNAGYQGRFLIVAGVADTRNSALAIRLGASGVFLKSEPPERLVQAIRLVASGDIWVDRKVIRLLADQVLDTWPESGINISGERLSEREQKVLQAIVAGLSNRKIGASIGMSESSVKNIIQHLFARTGVRTRSQLVRMALEGSLGTVRQPVRPDTSRNAEQPIVELQGRTVAAPHQLIAPGAG
jgi:two-component system, NarL family, nitrate/nitrite response regulator NarL